MSDDGTTINVEFDDDGSAAALARELAAALERGMGAAIGQIQKDFTKIFTGAASRNATREAGRATRIIGDGWEMITNEVNTANLRFEKVNQTIDSLLTSMRRMTDEFDRAVAAEDRATAALHKMDAAQDQIAKDPAIGVHFRSLAQNAQRASELAGRNLHDVTLSQRTELAKQAEQQRVSDQGQTTRARAAASERIVLLQQEGARTVAETRAAGQRRVAVIQAVNSQIRALERGLAAVFRGSASAFGALVRGAGSALGKVGSLFRRSDAQIASGIGPAMEKRTSIFRRSTIEQESILRTSATRQTLILDRLDAQLNSGVLGAASGRSRIGALLGGGLAFGGAFALVGKIRELATASADFEQSLAVLDAQLNVSDRRMESVRNTAIELGNDISLPGVSAKDAGEAIGIMSKQFAGMGKTAVPAAQAAAKGVLQLARAAKVGAGEAAGVVGAAVNVFGVSADRAVAVADQVAGALTQAAGVGFGDFALAFRQGASVFEQFQGPALGAEETLTEFNTALAVMARNALVGSDAGTSLKQFFLQANRNAAPAKKALAEVADRAGVVGSVFFDQQGNARALTDALDILRSGLKGMSDEQRNSTLQTIFGSDALRAANSLLKVSSPEYEKIRKRIQEQGLAAKIAAAQNTGMRGALDALNSVIETQALLIGRKLNVALGNAVLAFANLLQKVLSGEGIFAVFRSAVKGVAIALGGLLVAKAAGEAVRILAIAMRGLLSPFGILVLAVGAVGAILGVMLERSDALREAVGKLGQVLQEKFAGVVEFLQEQLGNLGDFLAETVLPALDSFSQFLADNLLKAFDAVESFIRNTVIPGFRSFVEFIKNEVVPVVRDFLANAFNTVTRTIQRFWGIVRPILQPAIDGISAFGDALAELFKLKPSTAFLAIGGVLAAAIGGLTVAGPIGALVAGLGASVGALFATGLGDELVGALDSIGTTLVDAIRPAATKVVDFLKATFSIDNLQEVAFGFLDLVEEVGRIIGSIVSDPRFLGAVAGIVAAAAVIAFRFIQGFARGIIQNIPELASIIGKGLKLAFEQALKGLGNVLTDPKLLTAILGAVFIGAQALSLWRRAGATSGQSFLQGLRQSAFGGVGGLGGGEFGRSGASGFLTAFLGGPGVLERSIISKMKSVSGVLTREVRGMRTILQTAGRSAGDGTAQGIRDAFTKLSADVGPAGIAGLRLRAAITATFRSLRTLSLEPLRQLGLTTVQAVTRIGRTAATALAGAFAGIQTGQALQGASGIQQLLGIGGLALALGAVNPLLGVTAGLAGALTIALGDTSDAAGEMAGRINEVADALRDADDPMKALSDKLFADLNAAAPDVQKNLDALGFKIGDLTSKVRELGTDAPQGAAGVATFVDLLKGNGPVLDQMVSAFEAGNISLNELIETAGNSVNIQRLGLGADDLRAIFDFLSESGIAASEGIELADAQTRILGTGFDEATQRANDAHEAFQRAFSTKPNDEVSRTAQAAKEKLGFLNTAAEVAKRTIDRLFGRNLPTNLEQAMDDLIIGLESLPSTLKGVNIGTALGQAKIRDAATSKASEFLGVISQAISDGEITTLPQINVRRKQFLEELTRQLNKGGLTGAEAQVLLNVTTTLNEATTNRRFQRQLRRLKLQGEIAALLKLNPQIDASQLQGSLQEQLDQLTTATTGGGGGIGRNAVMARGINKGIDVPITINPSITVGGTQSDIGAGIVDQITAGVTANAGRLSSALAAVVSAAVRSGGALTTAFARVGVAAVGAMSRGILATTPVAQVASAALAQQSAAAAQAQASAFVGAGASAGAGFSVGVLSQAGGAVGAGAVLASAAGAGAGSGSLFDEGLALAQGMAAGILAGLSTVVNAAISLATSAENAAKNALGISSPSRVFKDIGKNIGLGLADGLRDSETDINAAVTDAVQGAIEQAQEAFGRARVARAQAASQLFTALLPATVPGGPSQVDVHRDFLAVQEALDALRQIGIDAEAEDERLRQELEDVKTQLHEDLKAVNQSLEDRLTEISENLKQRLADAFARPETGLDIARQRINLGGLGGQIGAAFRDLFKDKGADFIAAARAGSSSTGAGRQASNIILDFGQQIRDLGSSMLAAGRPASAIVSTLRGYREQLIAAARAQGFNGSRLNELIRSLGLTDEALQRFANRSDVLRDQAANQAERARDQARQEREDLREAAAERIRQLRQDIITNTNASDSLNAHTQAGRQNRTAIIDALQSIRDFGAEALAAGRGPREVARQMREMRRQVVQTARSLGFNTDQIRALVQMLGLSNEAIDEFIDQLGDLNDEVSNPPVPTTGPGGSIIIGPGDRLPGGFRDLHVHVPFGDPEAVGLAVANRVAFDLAIPA